VENSIHWLVQEIADYPRIAEGVAPQGLLSEQESAKLATLHVDKRRRDWLLGRLTAKQLLQVFLQDEMGQSLPLDQIVIDNDSEGAPFASMNEERLACSLSISHSNGAALCAVHPSVTVGADMERIETRDWSFVRSYFTPSEIVQRRAIAAGTEKEVERQHGKGRLTARERINLLFDPDSFNEIDTLVTPRYDSYMGGRSRAMATGS
jgi:phosphopantetheinyl transferase